MASHPSPSHASSGRDPRVDFLRGFALLTIFIDHIPGNTLATLTLRNFGFADAAELFVILSGFSSMLAYGRSFERGVGHGFRRVAARCLRLYAFHVTLLLSTFLLIRTWTRYYGLELPDFTPFLTSGIDGLKHGLRLSALPPALDILPLYIVLLLAFPVIYAGVRFRPGLTLATSAALWGAANLDPSLNLTNWLDGRGWYFNPFAWQFLFVIGAMGARLTVARKTPLPRLPWLMVACWVYLAFALLTSAPWTAWGLSDFRPFVIPPTDKTDLAPLRLLDILALVYVTLSSDALRRLLKNHWTSVVEVCGKHSLEVFSVATVLSLTGRLLFIMFGTTWQMQICVNGFGILLLIVTAQTLERTADRARIARALSSA